MDKITWQGTDDEVKATYNGMNLIVQEATLSKSWNWSVTKPVHPESIIAWMKVQIISHGQHKGDIKTAMVLCEIVARAEVEK